MGERVKDNAVGSGNDSALHGLKTFLVEDEAMVSMLVQDILQDIGCVVVGTASSVSEALSQVTGEMELDVAILDVNLHGDKSFPIADALIAQGTPFIFATGFETATIAQLYPDVPLLHKPFVVKSLAETLNRVAHS